MDGLDAYQNQGEADIHDYLTRRHLRFEHEPAINGRNPDFIVRTPRWNVVLEVYEPEFALTPSSGPFDPTVPLHGAFKDRKRKQAQASRRAGLPFIAIVSSARSDISYDWLAAVGALRGRPGFTVGVGPHSPTNAQLRPAPHRRGKTGPDLNTSYSALAVVHKFNPTEWRMRLAQRAAMRSRGTPSPTNRQIAYELDVYRRISADYEQRGLYRPALRAVRLAIYHNPDAAIPLPRDFAGPHDEQWGALSLNGRPTYGQVAFGRESQEWLLLDEAT